MQDASIAFGHDRRLGPPAPPFVGRDAELLSLRRSLDLMLGGTRQVVLISGEPGIGKTQTVMRLAESARERGALALWGQCYEWQGAPAYWPWTQALAVWLREQDDAQVRSALGPHASIVAQILPEIRVRLPDLPDLPAMEPEGRRFHLLTGVAALLRNIAERQPLVLILDDVHWADIPTLQLLLFLAHEIRDSRHLFVATFRDGEFGRGHPGAALLADLARDPHCLRLQLRGLPKPQVAQLVALITGQAQSPSLVTAVHLETEGNPFFVTEVARLLAEEGQLDSGRVTGPLHPRVPESVREAIRRRLVRLSPGCNQALLVAAVIGRQFDLDVLARASAKPALELLAALDEGIQAQLIGTAGSPGSYRFGHALVQETIYWEAPAADRATWHLVVAEALEAISGPEPPWAELAYHLEHAGPLGAPEKLQQCSVRAGDGAMERYAWDAAASHYQRALSALERSAGVGATERCDLLLALGEAQNRAGSGAGDAPHARESYQRAFRMARELEDSNRMARAAVGYAGFNIVAAFGGRQQLAMLEQALAGLDPADSPLRVRVLARVAVGIWFRSAESLERSRALAVEAVDMARRLGDATLIAYALWAHHYCGHQPDNLSDRLADAEQLVTAAEETDDPIAAAWGYLLYLLDCLEAGNLFEAEQALAWLRDFDARAHIPYIALRVAAFSGMLDLATGRYASATHEVERARMLWQSGAPRQHVGQQFLLLRDRGRLDELHEEVVIPDRLHPWRQAAQAHRMLLSLERGAIGAARADYDSLVAGDFVRLRFDQHWFAVVAPLAEAAVAFNDVAGAEQLVAWLKPYAERLMLDGSLVVCHGPGALYLGRLAGILGRWQQAGHWLDQSLALCERLGLRPYAARTLLARAEVLVSRGRTDDHAVARDLARRAATVAAEIGMAGLLPRANALVQSLSPATHFGLTPRELDVLRLVAQGLSDAVVAEQLFLSPRTVGTHLTSIYGKLQVSSRTAAALKAVESDLLADLPPGNTASA